MRKDTGKYTLIAENANGKDEETVELTVLGKLSIILFIGQSTIYIYIYIKTSIRACFCVVQASRTHRRVRWK